VKIVLLLLLALILAIAGASLADALDWWNIRGPQTFRAEAGDQT
jgi:hypothetical protein